MSERQNVERIANRIIANAEPGRYIDLRVTPDGDLELTATQSLRDDADRFRGQPEMSALHDMLEDHTANSDWEFIEPEEVGALTSGALLADFTERDDQGTLTSVGNVYWDSNYQVTSTVDELLDSGRAVWRGNNAS